MVRAMDIAGLYRDQMRRLERRLARMLGSADAADVAHEAFLRVYAAELGNRTTLSSSLLTVTAQRLALNVIRNQTRRATELVGDVESLGVLSSDDPAAGLEAGELAASLEAAIAAMPSQCRRVFQLRKIEGRSHAEIAVALGIAPKTIERHLTKALRICRERLAADGHLAGAALPAHEQESA